MHTGFGICEFGPAGGAARHVHSYEESFYRARRQRDPGDARGLVPRSGSATTGSSPSASRTPGANGGEVPCRWADMLAPVPRARYGDDTTWSTCRRGGPRPDRRTRPAHPVVRPLRACPHGRPAAEPGPAGRVREHAHRAARLQRDHREDDGRHRPGRRSCRRCSWCSTTPTASPGHHDHPFEETYYFLEGGRQATFDGETPRARPRRRRLGGRRLRARLPQRR